MARSYDTIVVGVGILGASTAHYLAKKRAGRILLLDRLEPASGGTGKSAAIVRSFYTIPLMARLARDAVRLFHNLKEETGSDGGFYATGFTQLVPPEWVETTREKVAMHRSLGIDTDFVPETEWAQRFPWLNADSVGAIVFEASSGYADPVQTTESFFVASFIRASDEFRPRTPVRALLRQGRRHRRATGGREVSAGTVINAAGPWSKFLAESAGLEPPLRAVREQASVWEVRRGRPLPTTPVSNPIEAIYMRPVSKNRWLFGRGFPKDYFDVDPYNFKQSCDEDFILDLHDRWCKRIPGLQGATLVHGYAALYDVTPDWMPFVGPREGVKGYCDASGGSGHAFKTGAIFARELVDWIVDNKVSDDFRQLSFDRIARKQMFQQSFGGNRV